MIETALGAAGLAFTMPGVLDLMFRYSHWIRERTQVYRNAKGPGASAPRKGSTPSSKNSLELNLRKLAADVAETRNFLEKNHPDHLFKRLVFTISGEKRAAELNRNLLRDKQELCQTLLINQLHAQRFQKPLLLTKKSISFYSNHGQYAVPGAPNLYTTRGDYRDSGKGAYLETDMVVERLPLDEGTSEESIETIARLLHRRPSPQSPKLADISAKGSLPCLGYRMEPAPELVFRKPEGNLFMLHTLIAADQDEPRYPLDFRFQLARSLSEAVLGVHVQGLVHKSIRTDTILLVARPVPVPEQQQQQQTKKNSSMDVYLTNWHLLRKESDATIMSGGTQWAEDLYRHPRRQGLHVQERYNIGHDIYSLGVCLLEIGLWSLLLIRRGDEEEGAPPQVSRLVRAAAGVALQGGETADGEMRRKLKRPDEVKNILLRLAWDHLPQRMGRGYCRLVVACLTALDHQSGGFREGAWTGGR
ncbi:hypothetical protein PG990_008079 [Apiospora arundinis]